VPIRDGASPVASALGIRPGATPRRHDHYNRTCSATRLRPDISTWQRIRCFYLALTPPLGRSWGISTGEMGHFQPALTGHAARRVERACRDLLLKAQDLEELIALSNRILLVTGGLAACAGQEPAIPFPRTPLTGSGKILFHSGHGLIRPIKFSFAPPSLHADRKAID
jgi:hypothetical protein